MVPDALWLLMPETIGCPTHRDGTAMNGAPWQSRVYKLDKMSIATPNALLRLRKHADYQRVYTSSRKQFSKQMAFFYSLRPPVGPDGKARRSDTPGPRIGLTVGKVLGGAVERNRIKRRMRECVRRHAATLTYPVDVILHPRKSVLELEHAKLDGEIAQIFRMIQAALRKSAVDVP
jgi:ribonuclease P protein component